MKRFTKGKLPDTDVGPENPNLDGWQKPIPKEFQQTLRNIGRIEQLETGQADIKKALYQILICLKSSSWASPRSALTTDFPSWQNLPDTVHSISEFVKGMSLLERAQLAIQPIGPAIDQILPPYHEKLTTVTKLFGELEEDFDDIARRITRCAVLEEELAALENSLGYEETQYLGWCVFLIRDILDYNFAEDLTETHLGLLKKAMGLVHDKGSDCNKEDYQNLHKEFLQTGLALIPTTQKAIDKYGD